MVYENHQNTPCNMHHKIQETLLCLNQGKPSTNTLHDILEIWYMKIKVYDLAICNMKSKRHCVAFENQSK